MPQPDHPGWNTSRPPLVVPISTAQEYGDPHGDGEEGPSEGVRAGNSPASASVATLRPGSSAPSFSGCPEGPDRFEARHTSQQVTLRPVGPWDADSLRAFTCSHGAPYEDSVQGFFRTTAVRWAEPSDGCYVFVYEPNGAFIGVAAFEFDVLASEGYEWFVVGVAVDVDEQGHGLGGALLESSLDEMRERSPGARVCWHVDSGNEASHAMSTRVGAEVDEVFNTDDGPLTRYFVTL